MKKATDYDLSIEELPPVGVETLLKEKGYYDEEIHNLLQKIFYFYLYMAVRST